MKYSLIQSYKELVKSVIRKILSIRNMAKPQKYRVCRDFGKLENYKPLVLFDVTELGKVTFESVKVLKHYR